jgi:two-component system, NtrC family, sensor kinase
MTFGDPPCDARVLEAFIGLSHELSLTMREDEIVRVFSSVFEDLLPERLFAIRLAEDDGRGLKLVYANGRLTDEGRDLFRLTRGALEGLKLTPEEEVRVLESPGTERVDAYCAVFVNGVGGFEIALCDRTRFYGMINFEYHCDAGPATRASDRRIALPLAHQMSAALRNTRLIAETVFLKEYVEKLLDNANAPVIVVDRTGRITVVNKATERLTGFERGRLIGLEFTSLVPDVDRARLLPFVLSAMRGESATAVEVHIPRGDAKGFAHIAFNTAPILSEHGELDAVVFVGQDLTEVRNLQKQVIHTEKLATLGQVVAGVAHELNNPLTSITVYTNYLCKKLDGAIDEGDFAKLGRIRYAAERIQSFTRDLVTYARPSGEEPTLIRLEELFERSLSFCEHLIGDSEADVSLDVAVELPAVYGIRGQLEQVCVNLLTNACHALPDDGGKISISARPLGDDRVELVFADTGCGIAKENLSRVFEPFFTTKDQGEGTGLGLSIVRNILENHDGEITVTSELGEGTAFRIVLYAG